MKSSEEFHHTKASKFLKDYTGSLTTALRAVDEGIFNMVVKKVLDCLSRDGSLFFCGNGGSAAIADHFVCDYMKGISAKSSLNPKVFSLNSNIPIYSAIANDIDFDEVFSYQIDKMARSGDLLITVSSSGNSANIVNAIRKAKEKNVDTISLSGFDGGRSSESSVHLNVPSYNYGIVEDAHHALLHSIVQFIGISGFEVDD